jgi:hydrogenase nickel incorporation protein HypB
MCVTCGCGSEEVKVEGEPAHDHVDGESHQHSHAPGVTPKRMVQIEQDILAKNNAYAQ